MKGVFNAVRFYAALDEARRRRDLQWRDIAQQAEISPSTLTRMKDGRRPDVDGLAALLKWSGLQLEPFLDEESTPAQDAYINVAVSYLRADPHLDKKQQEALATLIRGAWDVQPKLHTIK